MDTPRLDHETNDGKRWTFHVFDILARRLNVRTYKRDTVAYVVWSIYILRKLALGGSLYSSSIAVHCRTDTLVISVIARNTMCNNTSTVAKCIKNMLYELPLRQ